MRKCVVLVCSSNQITYCLIPGTSPTQPRVKLTAGSMCIKMDGPFTKQKTVFSFWIYKHHSLFKGHNVNVNIVVLNCQKCNRCLKCHLSQKRFSNIRKPQKREPCSKKYVTSNHVYQRKIMSLNRKAFLRRKSPKTT